MLEQIWRVPNNHLIKKLNICNIPLSESEEYDIWWTLSMYSLLRVSLYIYINLLEFDVSCMYWYFVIMVVCNAVCVNVNV